MAIQPSSGGVGGVASSSNILLLASLPGRLKAQLTELPVQRIDVKWSAESSDETQEFILLHKSHCLGVCTESGSFQVSYWVGPVYQPASKKVPDSWTGCCGGSVVVDDGSLTDVCLSAGRDVRVEESAGRRRGRWWWRRSSGLGEALVGRQFLLAAK